MAETASPVLTVSKDPPLVRAAPLVFVALWSTGFIAAKFGAPVAGPFSLLALRMALVVPILAGLSLLLGAEWPRGRAAVHAMVAGALIHGVYLGGIFWAVKHGLPAGLSGLVVGLQPVLTALFARLLLGERLTGAHLAGLVLGLAGIALVLAPKLTGIDSVDPVVAAVALGAVAAIAFGTVYSKRTGAGGALVPGTALQFVGAALVVVPMAASEGFAYVPSMQLALVTGWLVLVLSIGAVLLMLWLMRRGAVSSVATLFYLVPPTTAFFAWIAFGETLQPVQIVGTVLVVAAVRVATRKGKA
ncbi:DMT family transporter [Chthonobacter rhizosphaerae]|uniref:DMT family transporter n=1 Tax=Chthonobacter rhizosphaerae TaxID=2735553 RepID=UPI001FEAEEF0|nr:DMT family transporter [Chthonobacter rhizosphaerae]